MKALAYNFLLMAVLAGCANLVCNFDQNSYAAAQALKVEASALMAKAGEPAASHQAAITALRVKLDAQLAYEQGKAHNAISAKQWEILISPERELLGKFLKDWQDGKTFDAAYLVEKAKQVSRGYDEILHLEGAKQQ